MKKIRKEKISQLYSALSEHYDLYLPIEKNGSVNFSKWDQDALVNLDALKTNRSPKNFLLPQSETYLNFKTEGKRLNIERVRSVHKDYVVFGVRPCDATAFSLLDDVFLREPIDRLYEEKRQRGLFISAACLEPEATCFCNAFDVQQDTTLKNVDVFTWSLEDRMLWQDESEKGKKLTTFLGDLLEDATDSDFKELETFKQKATANIEELPLSQLNPKGIEGELTALFDSDIWGEMSKSCLGCGACTYVCPTCHCYDIQDYDGQKSVERFRCWDSCMFSDFTLMAHGNPRKSQKERFRQRFMHKLVYYPKNHDAYACVGCGRCIEKCPVNMNIVKIIKKLGGESA